MKKRKVILDMDTGIDDALAIILALKSPELKILGITTVAGNAPVRLCSINTLRILEHLNKTDIPVIEGMEKPLKQPFAGALSYHGPDGLGEIDLPSPKLHTQSTTAWEFIAESVSSNPGEIILVATGPLTNIAVALQHIPDLARSLSRIVLMGGAFGLTQYGKGNRTPFAEFNIWQDPEAAKIVFDSQAVISAIGLDVSSNPIACLTASHLEQIQKYNTPHSRLAAKLIEYIINRQTYCKLHDPLALAAVLDTLLFGFISAPIEIITGDGWDRGITRVLSKIEENGPRPAYIANTIKGERFVELFLSRLRDV
jgi:inosine-uridine nucleoside N-ribohydrolase